LPFGRQPGGYPISVLPRASSARSASFTPASVPRQAQGYARAPCGLPRPASAIRTVQPNLTRAQAPRFTQTPGRPPMAPSPLAGQVVPPAAPPSPRAPQQRSFAPVCARTPIRMPSPARPTPQRRASTECGPAPPARPAVVEKQPSQHALAESLTPMEKIRYTDLTLLDSLGSGEFGQVFRGTYQGREVAIKQLYWQQNQMMPVNRILQDLEREIESIRHLRHKRLVQFIGACLELPHLCLITEYMPGGSLHHLLHVRKVQLPLSHGMNMCLQLADAVDYLHSQKPCVVHRDLKSMNVVLDLHLNVKICDFGLTESMERTHITKKNNGGSPRYMAPELFSADARHKITEKVDIWALGCIFIEICGGPVPYDECNSLVDLTRLMMQQVAPKIPHTIDNRLRRIIQMCLLFDFAARPTARNLFEKLKELKKEFRAQGLV